MKSLAKQELYTFHSKTKNTENVNFQNSKTMYNHGVASHSAVLYCTSVPVLWARCSEHRALSTVLRAPCSEHRHKKTCFLVSQKDMSSCVKRRHVFFWHKKTCLFVTQENMSSCDGALSTVLWARCSEHGARSTVLRAQVRRYSTVPHYGWQPHGCTWFWSFGSLHFQCF